jgi:hypothetical protein
MERLYFALCGVLGWLLRSARYSTASHVDDGSRLVRKRRLFYAPLLIWLSGPVVRVLNTGVRVLPKDEWQERERELYGRVYGASIRIEKDGTLVLPRLHGETLATLLKHHAPDKAIELAVAALRELHASGVTHGDAMAANVLVDLDAGVARWVDFETVHDSSRCMDWRRSDDLRALLATCLVQTAPEKRAGMLRLIVDAYADERVMPFLAPSFTSILRRPLAFHLGQAGLSLRCYREVGQRLGPPGRQT